MFLNKKIKIRIEKQFRNYIYINQKKYFNFEIVDFDIYFKHCIKSIDMLGIDENYYYIIEVKRDRITEEDYNNLILIMEKNKYDKPFKGILVGTRRNKKVEKLCSKNENIECKIIDDVIYEKTASKSKYFYICNKQKNYVRLLKKIFDKSDGMAIENYNITDNYIDIDYKYKDYKLRLRIDNRYSILYKFKQHNIFNDLWCEYKKEYINIEDWENRLFVIKNKFVISCMNFDFIKSKNFNDDYNKTYDVLFPLFNYVDLNKLRFKNNKIEITNTIFMGICLKEIEIANVSKCIIIPMYYEYIIKNNKNLLDNIKNAYDFNVACIIESCHVIIGKRLYKPLIKISINDKYITIKLSIELKNGNKIEKEYDITNKNNKFKKGEFKDEFFLICNIYFILNFEDYVKEHINETKSNIHEKYYDNITSYIYKNKLLGTGKTKKMTLRQIIEITSDIYKEGYDEIIKKEFDEVKFKKFRERIGKY